MRNNGSTQGFLIRVKKNIKHSREKEFKDTTSCVVRNYRHNIKHSEQNAECYKLGYSKYKCLVQGDRYSYVPFYKKNYAIDMGMKPRMFYCKSMGAIDEDHKFIMECIEIKGLGINYELLY